MWLAFPFDHYDIYLQQVYLFQYEPWDEIAFWPQRFLVQLEQELERVRQQVWGR